MLRRLRDSRSTPDDVLVMGAAGSTDPRARAGVDAAARMLGAAWGCPVPVGYAGGPGLPLADIVRDVARYVVAPGFFHERMVAGEAGHLDWATARPRWA